MQNTSFKYMMIIKKNFMNANKKKPNIRIMDW